MAQKKQVTLTSLFAPKRQGSEGAQDAPTTSPTKPTAPTSSSAPLSSSMKVFAFDPRPAKPSAGSPAPAQAPQAPQASAASVVAPVGSDDSDAPAKAPARRRLIVSDDDEAPAPKRAALPSPKAPLSTLPSKAPVAKKRAAAESESDEDDSEGDSEEEEASPKAKKPAKAKPAPLAPAKVKPKGALRPPPSGGAKYTPLQMQVLEVKAANPDVLLLVECGYKYRFFGEDAEVAAKVLGIWCGEDHGMASASVPTYRLHYHLARLVNAGHKVGVVSQTETAAVKDKGGSKTFARELTGLYTKSTLIDAEFFASEEAGRMESASTYLLCLHEQRAGGESGAAAQVQLSAVAVQASTGDVFYDSWTDDLLRTGLETLFLQLPPSELILPATPLSAPTERMLELLTKRGDIRMERADDSLFDRANAQAKLADFYRDHKTGEAETKLMLDQLGEGPRLCLAAMLDHLSRFRLDSILRATASFAPARLQFRMSLPASTLTNLEVFVTSSGQEKGSLFSIINRTQTQFGRRLLRKWLGAPLTSRAEIVARQEAVEELVSARSAALSILAEQLRALPDLERGICRAYYRKIGPAEFLHLLTAFDKVTDGAASVRADKSIKSALLRTDLFGHFPDLKRVTSAFLQSLNQEACLRNDKKEMLKTSQFPALQALQDKIDRVKEKLNDHLVEVRRTLRKPNLEYVFKQGQADYLLELSPNDEDRLPKSWTKVSSTKTVVRYHTPFIAECIDELALYTEQLQSEAQTAWSDLLSKFEVDYLAFRGAATRMATLDCLLALASVAKERGFVRPTIVAGRRLFIRQGRNPVVEAALQERGEVFIPNDANLDEKKMRAMLITGPNMGGKSCYIRQVAQIAILAQIGSFVPAEECEISPCDAVFTRMGASDSLEKGRSTFYIELLILSSATERSLVILDELGRGTSTFDGTAIAFATLFHMLSSLQCFTLFVTHYPILGQLERLFPTAVGNYNMSFVPDASADAGAKNFVTFLYKLVRGVAKSSFGMNVAHLAGIPDDVLALASAKSEQMRCELEEYGSRARLLASLLESEHFSATDLAKLQEAVREYLAKRASDA